MTENKAKWEPYIHDFIKYPGEVIVVKCQNRKEHGRGQNILIQSFFKDTNSVWSVLPRGSFIGSMDGERMRQIGTTRRLKGDSVIWEALEDSGDLRGRQELECHKCGIRVEACEDENLFPKLDQILCDTPLREIDLHLLGTIVRNKY